MGRMARRIAKNVLNVRDVAGQSIRASPRLMVPAREWAACLDFNSLISFRTAWTETCLWWENGREGPRQQGTSLNARS